MGTDNNLEIYWKALDRIIHGTPNVVRDGAKINNDLVSLEAGRKKGSIKKSREQFRELISAIDAAAFKQNQSMNKQKQALQKHKHDAEDLRAQLDSALGRELSLLLEIFQLKKTLNLLNGQNIVPIKGNLVN